jgi:hypothetical protein
LTGGKAAKALEQIQKDTAFELPLFNDNTGAILDYLPANDSIGRLP